MKLLLASALVLAFALPAHADHCTTWYTAQPEADVDLVVARYYWDNDPCQPCMWSTWVYQESNGIDGLQRADEVEDTTCHGMIQGDTIIF